MIKSPDDVRPELAEQWSEKNLPLTIRDISYGSNKPVWWKGPCGHEWQASPHSRTGGNPSDCPYCSGNRILPGFNDLKSRSPELAKEWSERNLPLTPDKVTPFSNRRVWWKGRCGHEWYALISSRSDGHGCPYCETHRYLKGFNDFETLYPELSKEWSDKNVVKPNEVTSKKSGLFLWNCKSCGAEYKAWISSRISGSGCPYCSGRLIKRDLNSLAVTHPDIAAEWDTEKNGSLTPDSVGAGSKKIVWWHTRCGHEWKSRIYDRTVLNIPCPKCEQEFTGYLPRLLVMLYAGRNALKVLFDSTLLTGLTTEMLLPDIGLALEESGNGTGTQEQRVKAHILETKGISYVLYRPFETPQDVSSFVREQFEKKHIFIRTDAVHDISLCREKFNLLIGRSGT